MNKQLPPEPGAAPRILVTRTDRIGDLVLSTPVFKSLRERFPRAWIAGLIFQENRELLEGNPYIDEVVLYDKKGSEKGVLGNLRFASMISRKKFDIVVHLHATNRMHWVGYLSGIPVRIGWSRKLAWTLTHPHRDLKSEGCLHESQYNFELLKVLDVPLPSVMQTFFPVKTKAQESLCELLFQLGITAEKPFVVLQASASCPSKRWPWARFAALAERLSAAYDVTLILIGGPGDEALCRRIGEQCTRPVWDLTGKLSLGALGALLRQSALLVSNDTGPVHIAAALGTPVISIFGRNQPGLSPVRWGPLSRNSAVLWKDIGCSPCLAHQCRINFLCLDVISVEDVMREVEKLGLGFQSRKKEREAGRT